MPRGGLDQGEHLVAAEDVGHEHRLLDRRDRVLGSERARIAAAPEQAQLPHGAELVAHRDGLAPFDARSPHRHGLLERHRTIAVLLADEAHEAVEDELRSPVADAHGALEREELGDVDPQVLDGDLGGHRGTGSETSRSGSVAMRT